MLDKARCTGGRKYQVLCVDTRTEENIMLNQELVERGLATSSDGELFKDSPSRRQDDSGEESDIEVDNCLVKLEDACKEVKPSDMIEDSAFEEDLYDVEVDDIEGFVKNMLGVSDSLVMTVLNLLISIFPPHSSYSFSTLFLVFCFFALFSFFVFYFFSSILKILID